MQPKVSIITPAFNAEEYLRECLESVVSQTLTDIEIICVNDGSTDGTLSIMKEFADRDSRVVVIDKANAGYGAGMNDGLKVARGEYIGIVESDDYILPEMYETYYKIAKEHGDLDMVKSDFMQFFGEGDKRTFRLRRLSTMLANYNKVVNPSQDERFFHMNNLCQPGIYRRAFLEENGIRYNETPGASYQDNGFWFQVFAQAQSAYFTKDTFYMLRRDNPNSSMKSKGKVYCMCEEYDYIRDILIKKNLTHLLGMCARKRFGNYDSTCRRADDRLLYGFFDRFGSDFRKLRDAGELDRRYFTPRDWQRLENIMKEGSGYYISGWLPSVKTEELEKDLRTERKKGEKEIRRIRSSNSFKIGQLATKPIRVLKRVAKPKKGNEGAAAAYEQEVKRPYETDDYQFNMLITANDLPEQVARVYAEKRGGLLDFDRIESYDEKVQLRKIHDPRRSEKEKLADKYAVREWIAERAGDQFLVKLYGVWDSFDDIDFDGLPNTFVLKATHGCVMTMVVKDKAKLDKAFAREQFEAWMKTNFAYCNGFEMQYDAIKPRIIAEEYLENADGDLYDYKFWCFDGKVRFIEYVSDRSVKMRTSFFDKDWNLLPFRTGHAGHEELVDRPEHLDEMVELAEKLADGFDHVRVDLYDTPKSGIKFGEMTFSTAGGYCRWTPPETDFEVGAMWDMEP